MKVREYLETLASNREHFTTAEQKVLRAKLFSSLMEVDIDEAQDHAGMSLIQFSKLDISTKFAQKLLQFGFIDGLEIDDDSKFDNLIVF